MDYQKLYNRIIQRAKEQKRVKNKGIYYESHHIIPKCIGGSDRKDNRALLTAKEHFVCHKCLCEMYRDVDKLKYALWAMTLQKNEFQDRTYIISSREYSRIKNEWIKNHHMSSDVGRERMRGKNNPMYGKKRPDLSERNRINNPFIGKGKLFVKGQMHISGSGAPSKPIRIINKLTNETMEFTSLSEASRVISVPRRTISDWNSGKYKSTHKIYNIC